jgi:hypothetical protein
MTETREGVMAHMTEPEWLAGTNPQPMLTFLQGKVTDRKLRLFACACCRRLWPLVSCSVAERRAIELAERYADGLASYEELSEAEETLSYSGGFTDTAAHIAAQSIWNGHMTATECAEVATWTVFHYCSGDEAGKAASENEERMAQADLLRDLLGNLFRPQTLDAAWLTSTVVSLTQAIYDERAFERMPILADALEDAGCTNAEILNHCRKPALHVPGCWVLDLLLARQ